MRIGTGCGMRCSQVRSIKASEESRSGYEEMGSLWLCRSVSSDEDEIERLSSGTPKKLRAVLEAAET